MSWLEALRRREPLLWLNPSWRPVAEALPKLPLSRADIEAAEGRLSSWAGLIEQLFPETRAARGIIESELFASKSLPGLAPGVAGRFFIKGDHALPVAGSIKARGGLYEVFLHAAELARDKGVLSEGAPAEELASPRARELFARHQVVVGSTGNLGLSIGIAAAALGFHAIVHMSADAKAWKKARLRALGVEVVEHTGDFSDAVAAGRQQASKSPTTYFVDDESSRALFLGYSVAASRLQKQLAAADVIVDESHPLFVYLPCGVGGGPGGITFGLRNVFGDHVHCFFVEPVASPCMLVRLGMNQAHASVYDVGLDNKTDADGLAVARASELAAELMQPLVSGIFTVRDDTLFSDLVWARDELGLRIEPSAAAGMRGAAWVLDSEAGKSYLKQHRLAAGANATHVAWTTGGSFVPPEEYDAFYERGRREWLSQ